MLNSLELADVNKMDGWGNFYRITLKKSQKTYNCKGFVSLRKY